MTARGQRVLKMLAASGSGPQGRLPAIRIVLDGADPAAPEAWLFGEEPAATGRAIRIVMPPVDGAAHARAEAGLPEAYHRYRTQALGEAPAAVQPRPEARTVVPLAPVPDGVSPEVAALARRVLAAGDDPARQQAVLAEVAAAPAAGRAAVMDAVRRMRRAND